MIQQCQTRDAEAYAEAHDQSYWTALVAEERACGERYIGATGRVDWLAAFAPKHFTHVMGIVDTPGVPAPDADVVGDLAAGITRVLTYYAEEGLNSFNLMLSLLQDAPGHQPVVHLVSRSVFDTYYVSDSQISPRSTMKE
jgi:UDPglucose--hexose-1-phosphate uridylyltransferase